MRVALTLSLLLLAVLAPAAQAAPGDTRIIIGRDPGLSSGERAAIRHDAGVDLVHTLRIPNTEVVTTDDPKAALAALRADPDVRYAQVDHVRHAFTNDPEYKYQWAFENTGTNLSQDYVLPDGVAGADMNVPEAWAQSTGAGIPPVAVVDSGVQSTHPDLAGQISPLSHSFVGATYEDGNGHGTHVAGIIAALRDNNTDVAGVAPGAQVMALKALADDGSGDDIGIAAAFDYAAANGAKIVNASLGGPDPSPYLADAIAAHPDVLFVFAAGNGGADDVGPGTNNDAPAPAGGDGGPMYPCNVPAVNVICVGASTDTDGIASFSNYGSTSVDLFAPGEYIASTVPGSSWDFMSGTSMASPHVAGEAALVLAAAPTLTPTQVKATILQGAAPKPAFAGVSVTGRRADAAAAVALAAAHSIPTDADGDGVPDDLDTRIDTDGDGVADAQDACPTVSAATANGCPAAPVVSTPAPTPAPAPAPVPLPGAGDADGDGRPDTYDLCPHEAAATTTGCPVPSLSSLTLRKARHRVTVKVRTSRAASVTVTVQRRACDKHGKHCKWRSVYYGSKTSRRNAATFSTRALARGRYRVTARVSSTAGKAKPAQRSISV